MINNPINPISDKVSSYASFGTFVDISNYKTTYYTAPSNGYFFISAETSEAKNGEIHSADGTNTNWAWFKVPNSAASCVFVLKGMRLKTSDTQGVARFYPLS